MSFFFFFVKLLEDYDYEEQDKEILLPNIRRRSRWKSLILEAKRPQSKREEELAKGEEKGGRKDEGWVGSLSFIVSVIWEWESPRPAPFGINIKYTNPLWYYGSEIFRIKR